MDCPSIKVIPIPRGAQYITQEVTFEFMHLDCRFLVSLEPFRNLYVYIRRVWVEWAHLSVRATFLPNPTIYPLTELLFRALLEKEILHTARTKSNFF
jgi:hypothetical protein